MVRVARRAHAAAGTGDRASGAGRARIPRGGSGCRNARPGKGAPAALPGDGDTSTEGLRADCSTPTAPSPHDTTDTTDPSPPAAAGTEEHMCAALYYIPIGRAHLSHRAGGDDGAEWNCPGTWSAGIGQRAGASWGHALIGPTPPPSCPSACGAGAAMGGTGTRSGAGTPRLSPQNDPCTARCAAGSGELGSGTPPSTPC